jgi:hypothetical protein
LSLKGQKALLNVRNGFLLAKEQIKLLMKLDGNLNNAKSKRLAEAFTGRV